MGKLPPNEERICIGCAVPVATYASYGHERCTVPNKNLPRIFMFRQSPLIRGINGKKGKTKAFYAHNVPFAGTHWLHPEQTIY